MRAISAIWAIILLALSVAAQNSTDTDIASSALPSSSLTTSTTTRSSSSSSRTSSFTRSITPLSSTTTTSSSLTAITTSSTSSTSISSSSVISSPSTSVSISTSASPLVVIRPTPTPTTTNNDVSSGIATDDPAEEEPSASATSEDSQKSSSGFMSNKAAVGATFTVVALVALGICFLVFKTWRNRKRSEHSARDTFFDTKTPSVYPSEPDRQSMNASMVSLGNQPMDPHSTPSYGATDKYLVDYNSYPPGASYNTHSDPAAQQFYAEPTAEYYAASAQYNEPQASGYYPDTTQDNTAYDAYNQYYGGAVEAANTYSVASPDRAPSISPHPYSHPAHMSGAPPSAMRPFAGRDSGYEHSIDSFYQVPGMAK